MNNEPLQFRIEQLALCPPDPEAAMKLLTDMGSGEWAHDVAEASGFVFGQPAQNRAQLNFEYNLLQGGAAELEVLSYEAGGNWMDLRPGADPKRVSHLGMHCSEEELLRWREFFADRNIGVAQEVQTTAHTNPQMPRDRRYQYVIFDTHAILGVDIKMIVRCTVDV